MREEYCDTILYNAKIVTVNRWFTIAEAVAIGGGKFLQVGQNSDILALADSGTQKVDLKGKTVVPGFIDTHPHILTPAIRRATSVPLSGLSSIEGIKRRVAEKTQKTPPGKWIVTSPVGDPPYYFNIPEALDERRWVTRWDLDQVSANNPVYISAPSSKGLCTAILNSYGLKLMSVNKETPSKYQGVEIVKDQGTGEPNGQIHGMQPIYNDSPFFKKLMSLLPRAMFDETLNALKSAIKERVEAGVTTGYEGHYVFPEHLLPFMDLWSRNELKMRVCFAYEIDLTKSLSEIETFLKDMVHASGAGFGDARLKVCGVTVSPDGPIRHGLALMNQPYLDQYGKQTTGVQLVPTEKLKQIALAAARNNLRFNVCIGGDKGFDITLEVFEEVNKEIPIRGRRWVIQGARFASQENIDQCKDLELSVTICTNFEWGEGTEVYLRRLGREFAAKAMPLRRWLDAGIPIAQSTDFGPYQPMFTLWQSLKRIHGLTGESFMGPDQRISREEALRMYTINGARVLFWEDQLGSIEKGKIADLVVLGRDILSCRLDEIKDTEVMMTMLGGEVVSDIRYSCQANPKV